MAAAAMRTSMGQDVGFVDIQLFGGSNVAVGINDHATLRSYIIPNRRCPLQARGSAIRPANAEAATVAAEAR